MKKLIIATLLLTLLAVPFLSSGTCLAEEDGNIYYYTSSEIPVFSSPEGEGTPLFYIPATYAYKYVSEAQDSNYIKIEYNGYKGDCYIRKDYHKNENKVSIDWKENYYYTFTFSITPEIVTLYKANDITSSGQYVKSSITINKVFGYTYTLKDNVKEYYFLIEFTSNEVTDTRYVKASDTSQSAFSIDNIPQNEYYLEEIASKAPDIDSGVGNTDGLQEPTNNLERYLLIAVIAVLCVVIVVLIFIPNKRSKNNN